MVLNIISGWFALSLLDTLCEAAETADIRVLQLLEASCATGECQCQCVRKRGDAATAATSHWHAMQ